MTEHAQEPDLAAQIASLQKWISRVDRANYQQVVSYIDLRAILGSEHPIPPLRGWAISPDLALFLIALLEEKKPRAILELGSGFSTVIFARYARASGSSVVSVEHQEQYMQETAKLLKDWDLSAHATLAHAPIPEGGAYYDLERLGLEEATFDFVFIDGPPAGAVGHENSRAGLLPAYGKLLKPGATMVMDDYQRAGEQEVVTRWEKKGYVELVREDKTLDKHAAILKFLKS